MKKCILAAILMLTGIGRAQDLKQSSESQVVVVPEAVRQLLKSAVNGTDYQIDVALPQGYARATERRYPVLYVLDSNAYFALLTDSLRLLRLNQWIPNDVIVVGIGYPSQTYPFWSQQYGASRCQDYTTKPAKPLTPASLGNMCGGSEPGGALEFLRFLREELIPYVDSNYRYGNGCSLAATRTSNSSTLYPCPTRLTLL